MKNKKLWEACEIVVADSGKEDDNLVQLLHDKIVKSHISKGKMWNYELLDRTYNKILKNMHIA